MPERAYPDHPIWARRFGLIATSERRDLERRYRKAGAYVRGKRVLDIPCGTGMGFPHLKSASALTGADRAEEAITTARQHYGHLVAHLLTTDMVQTGFEVGEFEVILCLEGIEHLSKQDGLRFLVEAARILEPGGRLILSWPTARHGQHTDNAFRLYEWPPAELVAAVSRCFAVERQAGIGGSDLNVHFLVARRKAEASPTFDELEPWLNAERARRADAALVGTRRWIERQWQGQRAAYADGQPPTLMATCFAVLAEECLGTLPDWAEERRQALASSILAEQDSVSGLFAPETVRSEDCAWTSHCDPTYIRHQLTYFALSALTALQREPLHPLSFLGEFRDTRYTHGWLDAGPWDNPWNHSNRIMFLLRFLIHAGRREQDDTWMQIFDFVLNYLDERQSPQTGLWHGTAEADVRAGVFAAYHFFPFYFWRGRCPRYAERILDAVLSIQYADGLFGEHQGGGACEDLDAIDTLVKFSLVTDYRADDIRQSLERALDRLLLLTNPDGGFPDRQVQAGEINRTWRRRIYDGLALGRFIHRPLLRPIEYYSGWYTLGARKGDSTLWAAWFRPLALALIQARFPELGKGATEDAAFHGFPCLGWHDQTFIIPCHKRHYPAKKN